MDCRKSLQKRLPDWVDEIWRANAQRIYKLCLMKCESKEDADDLFQEVALRFCKNADRLDVSVPVFSWLATVMFRCRSDFYKKKMQSVPVLCEPEAEYVCDVEDLIPERKNEDELDELSVKKEFDYLIQDLTPYEKMLIELSVVGGMTMEEMSRILGISKASVARRRMEAIKKMQKKLKVQSEEFRMVAGKNATLSDIVENVC